MACVLKAACFGIPDRALSCGGKKIPFLGLGTATSQPVGSEATKMAILQSIKLGYRHFDTAAKYGSEKPLGDAIEEAVSIGLIQSRDELFITELWCGDGHRHLVVPALNSSLQNLELDYLDLFLIHWSVSSKPETYEFPIKEENFFPMDFNSLWAAMDDCRRLGLTNSIGVSNFSCKKLTDIIAIAMIPPAVDQVSLRWIYEQGVGTVKSFNGETMKQNLQIFNWSLNEKDLKKIDEIPQSRGVPRVDYISEYPYL